MANLIIGVNEMKVSINMIHKIDTPVKTFKNHDEVVADTVRMNAEENIKKLKQANQIVGTKNPKRNELCICGSGKKFKKCCINKELV